MVFLFGLFFGSFANVCIYRLPRNESIVFPSSHCPLCQTSIHWYDNIPLFSFIFLGAKCRHCSAPISWRYPLVELLTGIVFAALFFKYQFSLFFWVYALVSFFLIVITFIDFQEQIIPDELSYSLIFLGLLFSFFNSELYLKWLFYLPPVINRLASSYLGLVIGGGVLYFIAWVSRGGMGGGDIKLAAGLGAFLGWENTLIMLGLSFFLGGMAGVILLATGKKKRKDAVPFGPFIALATFIILLYSQEIQQLISNYFLFF